MSAPEQGQRFAKALDTFASSQILEIISEAEDLASRGYVDGAFDKLDFAYGRLPDNVRKDIPKQPSEQLIDFTDGLATIEDYKLRTQELMRMSSLALKRMYFAEMQELKLEKFKEIKRQITDAMQAHNMYFQEIHRQHKSDAPIVTEI